MLTPPSGEQGDVNSTDERRKYTDSLDAETRYWLEEDAKYFLHQALSTPVMNVLSRTEGAYIYDLAGRKYLDLHGNGVHNAGFSNQMVAAAVIGQLNEQLAFTPRRYTNKPAILLAKRLVERTPAGLDRVLFCPGGSEAIEMALAIAKQITGKWKTLSYWDSYHGNGFQAASVGGEEHFKTGLGPMVPGAFHVEFPNYYRNPWGLTNETQIDDLYLRQISVILQRNPDMAAILGEPISSTPVVPSVYYWQQVRELCDQHGIFLIFDEIIEGFGRTGKWFACEHFVTPDVLVLGKSLGDYLREGLRELQSRFPLIGNVAGKGLHIGVDLVRDPRTKERAVSEAERIMYSCMEQGVALKVIEGNILTLRAALCITKDDCDWVLDALGKSLAALAS